MKLTLPPQEDDHALGTMLAKIILVEYGDFLCPHSRKVNKWILEILNEASDIKYIYRHFPIVDLHTHAVFAALAAEAAGLQGRFWEFQQRLYGNETPLTPTLILSLAESMNLDVEQLISDMDKKVLLEKIEKDLASGVESGVHSTPGFFLNGLRLEGPIGLEHLKENIDCVRRGKMLTA